MRNNNIRNSYNRYGNYGYRNNSKNDYRSTGRYNARYNYTSEAFDYVSNENIHPKRKAKRKNKVVYSKVKEVAPLSLLKTYGTIAVIFCFVLTILCMYASNSNKRTNLVALQDRLEATQVENEYMQVSMEDNMDLAKIESEALKLGLQKPAEYQIVEIDVAKDSYTVQYDSKKDNDEEGIWAFFKNIFKG